MKKITIIGVIIVVLIIILSVSNKVEEAAMQEGPIKIGFIGPLTGDGAVYGEPAQRISQIAVDEINADGGIGGRQLEVIYENGECTGSRATSAAQKLINVDGVNILTGLICSGEAVAVVPVLDEAGAFGLSMTATTPDLTGASSNFARIFASDAGQASALAEYATRQGFEKAGIIFETTDYATANKDTFIKSFDGEVISEGFTPGATDVRTSITKIMDGNVDALFITLQSTATGDKVLAQYEALGGGIPLIVDILFSSSPETITKHNDILAGSVSANVLLDDNDRLNALRESYKNLYGSEIPFEAYMTSVYDGIYLLSDAISEVGESPDKVSEWVYNLDSWEGVSGIIDIDENGDRVGNYTLLKLTGDEYVPFEE